MKSSTTALTAAALLLASLTSSSAIAISGSHHGLQKPLESHEQPVRTARKLYGRFLHITDIHPDPFYLRNSSISKGSACHRDHGRAGFYGGPKSDCDSPFSLANATFQWIKANVRDQIDFVVWTGDSARHDNDIEHPRTEQQIFDLNRMTVGLVMDTFGKTDNSDDDDPTNDLVVPVVPSIGNNDILPHNIFLPGPSSLTRTYLSIWRNLIPEEQTHIFERGAYFFTEVIPNRLAVFSLNTLYFYTSNTAVDGCDDPAEPGYAHFEWLRVQLDLIRSRGMKAMLTGHVPPANTESKKSWDESCYNKYLLWTEAYRDVIVGGLYGHMNLDHFMVMDTKEAHRKKSASKVKKKTQVEEDNVSIESAESYLSELRDVFATIPHPPKTASKKSRKHKSTSTLLNQESEYDMADWLNEWDDENEASVENTMFSLAKSGPGKGKTDKEKFRQKKKKYLKKIGGKYAQRYVTSIVAPSVIPNYFPSLRLMEYNITGLVDADGYALTHPLGSSTVENNVHGPHAQSGKKYKKKKGKKGKKKPKKPEKPDPNAPNQPPANTPPGPAYHPQSLTLTGITQYYANITSFNGWVPEEPDDDGDDDDDKDKSDGGDDDKKKKKKKKPKKPKKPKTPPSIELIFEVEYSTLNDTVYKMKDLTVRSYLKLARRIAKGAKKGDDDDDKDSIMREKKKNGKGKGKGKGNGKEKKDKELVWHTFLKRAFVGAVADEDIQQM